MSNGNGGVGVSRPNHRGFCGAITTGWCAVPAAEVAVKVGVAADATAVEPVVDADEPDVGNVPCCAAARSAGRVAKSNHIVKSRRPEYARTFDSFRLMRLKSCCVILL
jgi:hypothetical protein